MNPGDAGSGERSSPRDESTAQRSAAYPVLLQAWIDTRMERDRLLAALSAGGIGLLITLLAATGLPRLWIGILYLASAVAFILSLGCTVTMLSKNAIHLEAVVLGTEGIAGKLRQLDRATFAALIAGLLFFVSAAGSTAITEYHDQTVERTMSDDIEPRTPEPEPPLTKSLEGVEKLVPGSLQGVENLVPPPTPPAEVPQTTKPDEHGSP